MILLLFGLLLAQELTAGTKLVITPSYGKPTVGWFVDGNAECIHLSNQNGKKAIPVPLIQSVQVGDKTVDIQGFHALLADHMIRQKQRPKIEPNKAFAMGLLNTGLPFIFLEQPHAHLLTIADVGILVGGGVSAYQRHPTAVPLFLGLLGLRLWSAVEARSLARAFQREPPKDCI